MKKCLTKYNARYDLNGDNFEKILLPSIDVRGFFLAANFETRKKSVIGICMHDDGGRRKAIFSLEFSKKIMRMNRHFPFKPYMDDYGCAFFYGGQRRILHAIAPQSSNKKLSETKTRGL